MNMKTPQQTIQTKKYPVNPDQNFSKQIETQHPNHKTRKKDTNFELKIGSETKHT